MLYANYFLNWSLWTSSSKTKTLIRIVVDDERHRDEINMIIIYLKKLRNVVSSECRSILWVVRRSDVSSSSEKLGSSDDVVVPPWSSDSNSWKQFINYLFENCLKLLSQSGLSQSLLNRNLTACRKNLLR